MANDPVRRIVAAYDDPIVRAYCRVRRHRMVNVRPSPHILDICEARA